MAEIEKKIQSTLMNLTDALKGQMAETLKKEGLSLTPLYFILLKKIDEMPDCTALLLAKATYKDKGQMTRILKELIQAGLIEKRDNPQDKRSQFLSLSEQGQACYQILKDADKRALAAMTADISAEELALFISLGNKMANNLRTLTSNT